MGLYLIPPNDSSAEVARRKMEANYLRYRSDMQNSQGYGYALKRKSGGAPVDPRGKSDDEILADGLIMPGVKYGQLNQNTHFTESWSLEDPLRRLTDNKIVLPVPEAGSLQDTLLAGVPAPHKIEEDSSDWWPQPLA